MISKSYNTLLFCFRYKHDYEELNTIFNKNFQVIFSHATVPCSKELIQIFSISLPENYFWHVKEIHFSSPVYQHTEKRSELVMK